jgi:hypothetical protein
MDTTETQEEYEKSTQCFDLSVIDRRIFRELITNLENIMFEAGVQHDEDSGINGMTAEQFNVWAEKMLSDLGTP